jgi:hypothetical protein
MMRTDARLGLLVAVVMALAACTANSPGAGDDESPAPARGTSPNPDLSTVASESPKFTRGYAETFVPETVPSTDERSTAGSGCAPGTQDGLPDGMWRGFLTKVGDSSVDFDLICSWRFDSDKFHEQIRKHKPEDGPVIYVTENDNPLERTLDLADNVKVWPVGREGQPWTMADYREAGGADAWDEAWVLVNGGVVTEIVEVYYP